MELVETSFVFFAHKILYLASINISPVGLFQKDRGMRKLKFKFMDKEEKNVEMVHLSPYMKSVIERLTADKNARQ